MKSIISLVVFIVILNHSVYAQKEKLNYIGINASVSQGELIRYGGETEGGLDFDGKIGFLIGIGFCRVINDKIDLETGIDYTRKSFNSSYIDAMGHFINNANSEEVYLLSIPLNVRVKFKKHFSLTGGIEYDQTINQIDCATIDSQTGFGANIKFGRDFRISNNMILYLAPEIVIHDLIPFHPEKFQQRLTEFGLRITYKFGI